MDETVTVKKWIVSAAVRQDTEGRLIKAAIMHGDLESVKNLVQNGLNVNRVIKHDYDRFGRPLVSITPIQLAAQQGRREVLHYLLRVPGAQHRKTTSKHPPGVNIAITSCSLGIIHEFIDANKRWAGSSGVTYMHKAIRTGSIEVVELLEEQGGVDFRPHLCQIITDHPHLPQRSLMPKLLDRYFVNIEEEDCVQFIETVLQKRAASPEFMEACIKLGLSPDHKMIHYGKGEPILNFILTHSIDDATLKLLDLGASVYARSPDGSTAWDIAEGLEEGSPVRDRICSMPPPTKRGRTIKAAR